MKDETKDNLLFEELSINAWPALQTIIYDGWVVRFADAYANRGNSVSPLYPSKAGLEEKLLYCTRLFTSQNIPPSYKLTNMDVHREIDGKLEKMGYKKINETSLQVCNIPADLRQGGGQVQAEASSASIIIKDEFYE